MAKAKHNVVVLGRPGHGMDFTELYHVNKDTKKDDKGKEMKDDDGKPIPLLGQDSSIEDAKALAINFIREHRAGAANMDYRIKDLVSGQLLD